MTYIPIFKCVYLLSIFLFFFKINIYLVAKKRCVMCDIIVM